MVVLGRRFVEERKPQMSDMHFQITHTSDHVRDQRAKKEMKKERKKERKKKEVSLVKYKSADMYVGRPKNISSASSNTNNYSVM